MSATPISDHTISPSQRQMPTRRTLAASTLNQARTPAINATSAMIHAVTGPQVTAAVSPMSKNVASDDER